jgi:predicted nucleotidyltransferase
VIRRFSEAGVDFVVIGGTAVVLHGSSLLTEDTDVMYRHDLVNVRKLAEVLTDFDISLRGVDEDIPFKPDYRALWSGANFTLVSRFGELDLLAQASGVTSYEELQSRAVSMRIADRDVKVASIDDLITMKGAVGREKDKRAILDLEEIKKIRDAESQRET